MRLAWFSLALMVVSIVGLYGWYGTLHPCEMLKKDILRSETNSDSAGPAGEGDMARMLNQLLGDTITRPLIEVWLVNKSPGECARSLVRYHTDGEL